MLTILQGDCLEQLKTLPDNSVQCCVTSPPYWGLRSYLPKDHPDKHLEIGQEKTPAEYVAKMLAVFREVRRALRPDGTLWLNLGDTYAGGGSTPAGTPKQASNRGANHATKRPSCANEGFKAKDLIGIPWRVAFALQADGWWLRSDIIWAKPNCMPESVTDRPTRSHEYLFLLTKSDRYYYDAEAIKEPPSQALIDFIEDGYRGNDSKDYLDTGAQSPTKTKCRIIQGYRNRIEKQRGHSRRHNGFNDRWDKLSVEEQRSCGANKRDVWWISPACYPEAHFATFPPDLIKPCILAGTKCASTINHEQSTVLDPFGGSGTTGQVALELGRHAILIELNAAYRPLIDQRTNVTAGLALA